MLWEWDSGVQSIINFAQHCNAGSFQSHSLPASEVGMETRCCTLCELPSDSAAFLTQHWHHCKRQNQKSIKRAAFICISDSILNSEQYSLSGLPKKRCNSFYYFKTDKQNIQLSLGERLLFPLAVQKVHSYVLWALRSFFPCSNTLLSCTKRIQIPPSSRYSKLTYIMCLERRFFNRGSEALSHAVQDYTDQWPSTADRPPPWHHTFHNMAPKDAHTERIWSFDLYLFKQSWFLPSSPW